MVCPGNVIDQGCLLWRLVYAVVDGFRDTHPEFMIVRHDDLSRDPGGCFQGLFASLDLDFTSTIQQTLAETSQGSNPGELSTRRVHSVKLDSQANLSNWQKRLTQNEIEHIRDLTADVASKYYPEEPWE